MMWRLARPMLWRLVGAGLLATATELAGLGLMATATWLLITAAGQPPITALTVAIVTVRALAVSRGTLRYAERLASHDAVLRIVTEVRARVFAALADRPALVARRGDALSRMVSDVDAVQDLVVRVAIPAAAAGLAGVLAVAGASFVSLAAAVVLALGLAVGGVLLPLLAARLARSGSATLAPLRAAYAVATIDLVHGAADLAAFGARSSREQAAAASAERLAGVERALARRSVLVDFAGSLVSALTAAGVVLAALAQDVPGVWVGVLAVGTLAAGEIALSLVAAARKRTEIAGALDRLRPLLTAQSPEWSSSPTGSPEQSSSTPTESPRPQPIEIRDVSVQYRTGGPAVLDRLSLTLAPGSRTAVVGPSGAGKSTLLALLNGSIPPSAGEVRYGGEPLPSEAYQLVGGLFADAAVFHASIAENVALGRTCDQDELDAAARAAGLLDWIEAQPEGWDTLVGEDGGALSGGQRQRLALTRALVQAPPVLLLDEPTEGLDSAHADEVLMSVLDHAGGRTIVLVTHRHAELSAFDQVITVGA
jgi:ATP-binding cassette subfamily C protein CydC